MKYIPQYVYYNLLAHILFLTLSYVLVSVLYSPQQQPKLHCSGRVSPVRAPRRNINQVHPINTNRGIDCSGNKARNQETKGKGIDWTAVHKTNRWRTDFQSDSDGDIEDHHLFTGANDPASVGRPTSP